LTITTGLKSLKGAALAIDFTIDFTTRYFHDNEIGIDFTYFSNDLALTEDKPIYIEFWSSPLKYVPEAMPITITVLPDYVITESGKLTIPVSALPEGISSGLFKFFHDLDEDYPIGESTNDDDDSILWYNSSETGNMITDDAADGLQIIPVGDPSSYFVDANGAVITMTGNIPDSQPAFYNVNPDFIMSPGHSYSVLYTDGSPVAADPFETNDDINNYWEISHGTYEIARTLHTGDDIDYLRFTPSTNDYYEIRVRNINIELMVGLYESLSDAVTETSPMSATPGTRSDDGVINSGGTYFEGDTEYFIRIESPSGGLDKYEIGYFYKPADADAFEDSDDVYSTAPTLTFGRDNVETRTLEASDTDYFEVTIQNGLDYVIEVEEDPTYFDFSAESRNIEFDLSLIDSDGNGISAFDWDSNRMVIKNKSGGIYYIGVVNNSTSVGDDMDQPSGQYRILITYSYDDWDQPDDPSTSGENEYDMYNEHSLPVDSYNYVYVAPEGINRTIYSVPPSDPDNDSFTSNPGDDVDWIRFDVYMSSYIDYLIYTEPIGGIEADGIVVNFQIYPSMDIGNGDEPDTSGDSPPGGQPWISDDTVRGAVIPVYSPTTYFAKITRDSTYPSNPITGAYRFHVIVGADAHDNSLPDSEVIVYDGEYGNSNIIHTGGSDETPWIEKDSPTGSTDYSIRNQLPDWDLVGSYEIPTVFRTFYRKDYDFRGESDGTTLIYSDVDFFWYEIPSQMNGLPIDLYVGNYLTSYSIPLKVSLWNVTAAEWNTWTTNTIPGVITETELGTADHEFTYYDSESYKIEEQNIAGGSTGDYIFLKVEADTTHLGATYQDINGYDQIYEDSGQYDIKIRRHY